MEEKLLIKVDPLKNNNKFYFVSTAGNVSSETIKWYVDTQKTRP